MIKSTKESKEVLENKVFLLLIVIFFFISIPILSYSETPSIRTSLESSHYNFGQPIRLTILVQNGVQHNSISLEVYDPDKQLVYSYSWGNQLDPITEIKTDIMSSSKWSKEGQYTVKVVYYGDSSSYSDSITFFFDPKTELVNYFPTREDIGTEWIINEIKSTSINVSGFDYGLCQRFQPFESAFGFMSICFYKFNSSDDITKEFHTWKTNAINEGGFKTMDTSLINADNCIGELFPVKSSLAEAESRIMCQKNNVYFDINAYHLLTFERHWIGSESDILKFAKIVADKIPNSDDSKNIKNELNTQSKNLATFVDPNKDTQYYLDRYYNEPEYKAWFDRNYPDYTIEEAVGLEPKPKIPEWIKSIFAFYLDGKINDDELVKALQFLVKEGIIKV